MAEAYNFEALESQPLAAHTIKVYDTGTTDLVTGLTDRDGATLVNPFTVTQAGGEGVWGFIPPDGTVYDVYWDTQSKYLGKKLGDTTEGFTETNIIDGAHTFTKSDAGVLSYINANLTLPEASTEVIAENKSAAFYNETDGDLTILTEDQVRVDAAGVTLAARRAVIIIKDQHFDPLDTLTSGDTMADAIYRIEAQSLVDFTTIGAADNNVGTIFTSTGIVTMTAADSLTPAYDFTMTGGVS